MNKRPIAVVVIACLYIVTGVLGTASHAMELLHGAERDMVWAVLVSVVAIVAGAYMLRASNWARWLAVAWIGFHVVLSAFHSMREMAVHALLCAAIAYLLFRSDANQYFRA